MTRLGRAPQTQRLVYATVKKMFGDAVENFQYLTMNPVLKKLQPVVPEKEAPHLNLEAKQLITLLKTCEGQKVSRGHLAANLLGPSRIELRRCNGGTSTWTPGWLPSAGPISVRPT